MNLLALVLLVMDPGPSPEQLDDSFRREVRPLLQQYCSDCHGPKVAEAEIDLTAFADLEQVRTNVDAWLKVREMLDSRQMPPRGEAQPSEQEHGKLRRWVRDYLVYEASQSAGDPGQVVLRRLSNAEYAYTLRDLTGVVELDPAEEFPVDGAAGEGFTNAGAALVMSPSLIRKYLDAAKEIAEHAMLLPDGLRFTNMTTRRDRIDQLLERVRSFYGRYTEQAGGSAVNLQGVQFETNQGGRLPLQRYLSATLELRDAADGDEALPAVAHKANVQPKYLALLYAALTTDSPRSFLLEDLRQRWRAAEPADAARLAQWVDGWRQTLWTFNAVGQLGRAGGPQSWMSPALTLQPRYDARVQLPAAGDALLYLSAKALAGEGAPANVVWRSPRLEFPDHAPLPLRDVRAVAASATRLQATELPRSDAYLHAIQELHDTGALAAAADQRQAAVSEAASRRQLDAGLLQAWLALTVADSNPQPVVTGRLPNKLAKVQGYEAINGWGADAVLSLLTNDSAEPITFLTLTVPARGVTLHPSPTREAAVVWRSPLTGEVRLEGLAADADDKCGNGAVWRLDLQSAAGGRTLAEGVLDNGGRETFAVAESIQVTQGDLVRLNIGPRDGDHVCDTTHVQLKISAVAEQRAWSLSEEIIDRVLNGNPLPDSFGNADVWHFCGGGEPTVAKPLVPPESSLAAWTIALAGKSPNRDAVLRAKATAVGDALVQPVPDGLSPADQELRRTLRRWLGPLNWIDLAGRPAAGDQSLDSSLRRYGIAAERFGNAGSPRPEGIAAEGIAAEGIAAEDLLARAPQTIEVRLPAELAADAEFVVSGSIAPAPTAATKSTEALGVQLEVALGAAPDDALQPALPLLSGSSPASRESLEAELDAFRSLFPAALCYTKIVPVDEVVTLTLYHREDDQLRRLMLDERQAAELDRMWDELLYVAQEPLASVVAFEQISEFATQDRPDLVKAFAPMKSAFLERADAFRRRMLEAEEGQLQWVLDFADRAWRRPLSEAEIAALGRFYTSLRADDLPHEEALRLTIARVLISPAFLYRLERPAAGEEPAPVSSLELACRLSYFLWSSLPDEELRTSAASGALLQPDELQRQTQRMLQDARSRRMAIHFACQWLHVRDFDRNDDKNERLYPEFAELRGAMYEETVQFFADMFRNNGSVLSMLDADHSFVNEALARHYGLAGVKGADWRRVEGVQRAGRGGVLGMATILASQSGASRTSPILRGNWVFETLLGERLPRPPANVPQLPETLPAGLTARQLIERHSSNPACAKCHVHIDPFGFALEQYDAIGRLREEPVDTRTKLLDGDELEGLNGLRSYLVQQRRDDFLRQFCRKLLGYALGREVQLSDELLLIEMMDRLRENDYRFHAAVDAVVASPQFRLIRGVEATSQE